MKQIWLYAALILYMAWYSPATTAQNPNDFCKGMVYEDNSGANASSGIMKINNDLYVLAGLLREPMQSTWGSIYVVGIDICGNASWHKSVGTQYSKALSVECLSIGDNNFMVLAGYCADYTTNPYYDWLLLKFNAQGDTLWSKTYNAGNYDDFPWCIAQTQDGGFIMGGSTDNSANGGEPWQAWLIKTDSEGNVEWNKTYGFDNASEKITGIIPNADGTYTIAASRNGGATSTWVFKTDSVGNILWNRIHGNGNFTYPYTIKALPDGYLIAGIERIYGYPDYGDGFLLKTDTLGNQQWFKLFGGPFTDGFTDLHVLENGGVIALGAYENNGWGGAYADAWLMKLTAEGDSIWSHTYAYNGAIPIADYVWGITDMPQGGFMFSGFTSVFNTDSTTLTQTAWVVRTDSLGNACYLPAGCEWAVGIAENSPPFEVAVYPNPAQNTLQITTPPLFKGGLGGITLQFYTLTGQPVLQTTLVSTSSTNTTSKTISVAHLPVGLYLYVVSTVGSVVSGDTDNGEYSGNGGGAVLARGKVAVMR